MKKLCFLILTLALSILPSCDANNIRNDDHNDVIKEEASAEIQNSQPSDEATDESIDNSINESVNNSQSDLTEIYEFLKSPYTVTSTRESFGTIYEFTYYLIDNEVAGTKLITTFQDEATALEYYEAIAESSPDAQFDGISVIHYLSDDDNYYYGFTLEKLKFVLEKSGYEYNVNFLESIFTDQSEDNND